MLFLLSFFIAYQYVMLFVHCVDHSYLAEKVLTLYA